MRLFEIFSLPTTKRVPSDLVMKTILLKKIKRSKMVTRVEQCLQKWSENDLEEEPEFNFSRKLVPENWTSLQKNQIKISHGLL